MKSLGHIAIVIAAIALFASCNRDNQLLEASRGEALRVNVQAFGFRAKNASTRTVDAGYTTTFVVGDCIGITVIKDGETIIEDNIPYRYDGSAWTPLNSANAIHRYPGDISYLVYYPYDAAMNGKMNAAEIFAAFTPNVNQGTQSSYSLSTLMTGYGVRSAAQLDVTLEHALAMVEINLPAGSSDVTLSVDGEEYLPYNITGTTYRCVVKPAESVALSGEYTIAGTTMRWQQEEVTLVEGEYTRINATNAIYVGNVTINYTDGSNETVIYDPLTGNIPLTHSGKTVGSIELPDAEGKSHVIGCVAGVALELKIQGNGDLMFRAADNDGNIPIGSYAEFQLIGASADALGGSYRQETNLDFMNREWTPVGSSVDESNFNPFSGTYNGNGYTVANLKIDWSGDEAGLFGCIFNAEINDVHIISGNVTGQESVGGICGYVFSGSVIACSNTALISGADIVGGVVGGNSEGSIIACLNTGEISGQTGVGGIAGNNAAKIVACYNTGMINAGDYVGGIAGINDKGGSTTACYNTGVVAGTTDAGGVVGVNFKTVTSCYWRSDTATVGVNNMAYTEEDNDGIPVNLQGEDVAVASFTVPPGFTPDSATYPQWSVGDGTGDGYWKNYNGNGGLPQLWWE